MAKQKQEIQRGFSEGGWHNTVRGPACVCVCLCVTADALQAHYSYPASSFLSSFLECLGLCQGVTLQTNSFASHTGAQHGHLGFVFA